MAGIGSVGMSAGGPVGMAGGSVEISGGLGPDTGNIVRPSNFGGGIGRDRPLTFGSGDSGVENPLSRQINYLFKQIEEHMGKFEIVLGPLFKRVPSP